MARKRHGSCVEALGLGPDDGIFFAAGKEAQAAKLAGAARTRVAEELGLIKDDSFQFCWIVDFPMFEYDEEAKKVDFSHNPFSMPQGGLEALESKDPLDILAFQYDIVCNGVELSLGRDPQPPARTSCTRRSRSPATRRRTSTPISPA